MRCTSNFRIKINRSNFLNFFIVPPPPIIGRDEPNNTSMTLCFYYSTIYSYCLCKLTTKLNSKLNKAQVYKWYRYKPPDDWFKMASHAHSFRWGTPLRVVAFEAFSYYLNYTNAKDRNMLLNKPTVGSVWEGICCGLSFILFSYERHKAT